MNNFFSNNRTNLPHFTGYAMHKMGCSRKNPKKGGGVDWGYTFLKNPWNFSVFYFTLGNSRQNKVKAHSLDIPQNYVRSPSEFPAKRPPQKPRALQPGNSLLFFLVTLGNSTSFLINPWKFHMLFFDTPGNFISLTPPRPLLLDHFFWNSPRGPIPTSWIENCPERQEERNF